jgi:hypothetical protein
MKFVMKFVGPRPFVDPDAAARKLVEIANGVEAVQDGRIFIERVNEPFLAAGGNGEQFRAGTSPVTLLTFNLAAVLQTQTIGPTGSRTAEKGGPCRI